MHAAASLAQLLMAPPHCRSSISVQAGSCKYFGRWTQQFISLPRCNLTRWQELGFKYLAILQFCAEYTAQPRQRRKRGQDEDTIPECSGVLNEKDRQGQHLVGTASQEMKAIKPVRVAPEILARYVGTYDFRWPENPTIPSLWPVTMANGELFLQGAPLIPLSETKFVWAESNPLEFIKDAQGRVTHFIFTAVEGNLVVKRIPDEK